MNEVIVYGARQILGGRAIDLREEKTYVHWKITGKGAGIRLPFADEDESSVDDVLLRHEEMITIEDAPVLIVSGKLKPIYHQGKGIMAYGRIPADENEFMDLDLLEVYAYKALSALQWQVDALRCQETLTDIPIECLEKPIWQWDFTTQSKNIGATRTDTLSQLSLHYLETNSAFAPIYAWGGRYQLGIPLERIAPIYISIKGDTQDRSLRIEFADSIDVEKYSLVGADHSRKIEGVDVGFMNLKQLIEFGSMHLNVKIEDCNNETVLYKSCKIGSYYPSEGLLNIIFVPE